MTRLFRVTFQKVLVYGDDQVKNEDEAIALAQRECCEEGAFHGFKSDQFSCEEVTITY